MTRYFRILPLLALSLLGLVSCQSFLDEMPDNRAVIDTEEEIVALLTSAYPEHNPAFIGEFMSDNAVMISEKNTYTDRFFDQVWHWEEVTESHVDSPLRFWEESYRCIETANDALDKIDVLEAAGKGSLVLDECRAEALICRAYNAFMLVNIFCKNFNQATSSSDAGIPYPLQPDTELFPNLGRGTVAGVYQQIEKDLLQAFPLLGDTHYAHPSYHFNHKAAYAFAARFYLYWEKWEEAERYASLCLGSDPASQLRDYEYLGGLQQGLAGAQVVPQYYVREEEKANLLLIPIYSLIGVATSNYTAYAKYSHCAYLADNEDYSAHNVWGNASIYETSYNLMSGGDRCDIAWHPRLPYLFQYVTVNSGYYRSIYPAFSTDECLLNRAEARVMMGRNQEAADDINLWVGNYVKDPPVLSVDEIVDFYNSAAYSYEDSTGIASTIKKHLHPAFSIGPEGSVQEAMLQCVIGLRRMETLHLGLRWFDVRRFGIVIPRILLHETGMSLVAIFLKPEKSLDWLTVDDPRRAVQIPYAVSQGGLDKNPEQ